MNITFCGYNKPHNYKRIDKNIVRSAQPKAEEIVWLKENRGLTDIINFRRSDFGITFNEQKLAESLNINYHSIPTSPRHPKLEDIKMFLTITQEVKKHNGKALIHCFAGADRTGFNALIYKVINGLSDFDSAAKEMLELGHHKKLYPNLIETAAEFIKKLKK